MLRLLLAASIVLLGVHPQRANADAVTGTWTGDAQVRGNYYWDRSTRVLAPEFIAQLEAPQGTRMRVDYLVDSITSASIAAGALEDVRFTEVRHDVDLKAGHEFVERENPVDLFGGFRLSREPDYFSFATLFQPTIWLADRATMFRGRISYRHDEIGQTFRGGSQQRPDNMGGTSADAFRETLDAVSLAAGWEQVLSRTLVLEVGYDFTYQWGFLANPYRSVLGGQIPENHPGQRYRHLLFSRLAWYIPRSRTSLQVLYRSYVDNWKVSAVNPEFRIYQEMSPFFQTRLRYRYYTQTSSFFYKSNPNDYSLDDQYVTADPKLSELPRRQSPPLDRRRPVRHQLQLPLEHQLLRQPSSGPNRPTNSVLGDRILPSNPLNSWWFSKENPTVFFPTQRSGFGIRGSDLA
ncbi:MAG: DUF3570 domain-containing protein [Deltaproteobacteria bacterium]|nr:DUF3570 domain-containing protein [Deltaproteobacteria bacterium]